MSCSAEGIELKRISKMDVQEVVTAGVGFGRQVPPPFLPPASVGCLVEKGA